MDDTSSEVKEMKLAIHDIVRGKPEKAIDAITGKGILIQNGLKVNLGYGWITIDTNWDEVFEIITVDGVATAAALTSENRCEANYESRQLVMVDIDSGMKVEDLSSNQFYQDYGAGYYTTPSHTEENHRFRIMFITQEPITDPKVMRKIIRGLLMVYESADVSCKDAARLFFGTVNAAKSEKRSNILSFTMISILSEMVDAYDQEQAPPEVIAYTPVSDDKRKRIIELLKHTPVYNYTKWRDIGWAMKKEGFSLSDYQYVTNGMMKQKSSDDAAAIWKDATGSGSSQVTMGTIIKLLKDTHGADCLKGGICDKVRKWNDEMEQINNSIARIKSQIKEINESL